MVVCGYLLLEFLGLGAAGFGLCWSVHLGGLRFGWRVGGLEVACGWFVRWVV